MKHVLALPFLLLAAATAGAVEVRSRPAEVTVYPQGALVVRRGEASLPAGQVTVSFPDLPASADESSVRLSVEGPRGTKFYGMTLKRAFTPEEAEVRIRDLKERIEDLLDEQAKYRGQIEGRKAEMEILKSVGKGSAEHATGGSLGGLTDATAKIGARIAALTSESRKDERAINEVEAKIQALRQEMQQIGGGAREKRSAEAELELPGAGSVKFELTYINRAAWWKPVYDLRLDTGKKEPQVSLAFGGEVRQSTGEDWPEVKLTISTARPEESSAVPDPTEWWLDFWQPRPLVRRASRYDMESAPAAASLDEDKGGALMAYAPAPMETAETVAAEYAANFAVKRPVTIPADGTSHRVGIAESSHDASLLLVTVPRLIQAAFIETEVKYGGEQALIPGEAKLFRDEVFVGVARLDAVGPGETFRVGFGRDKNMKVERKLIAAQAGDRNWFVLGKSHRRYRWVTTAKNNHGGARTLEVREQMPRSRRSEIAVNPLEMEPALEAEDPMRPGLKRWRINIPAGAEKRVVFSYEVKFPPDKKVSGLE